MIKTPTQLKALVKNQTHSDSGKAQLWFRNYAMERFLERISLSAYRDNFILKGGMLVSSMVGINSRATMDMDTTVRNFSLDKETAHRIIQEISAITLGDNMRFKINDVSEIMEEADYPGLRISMNAFLDTMRIPLKIDISTGDAITPAEISYRYKTMFEDRYIDIWAYNLETVLAEKMETLLVRGALSTRMRDFYDMYILQNSGLMINDNTLYDALVATSRRRGSSGVLTSYQRIAAEVCKSQVMEGLWNNYRRQNGYAADLEWETVSKAAFSLCDRCLQVETALEMETGVELIYE